MHKKLSPALSVRVRRPIMDTTRSSLGVMAMPCCKTNRTRLNNYSEKNLYLGTLLKTVQQNFENSKLTLVSPSRARNLKQPSFSSVLRIRNPQLLHPPDRSSYSVWMQISKDQLKALASSYTFTKHRLHSKLLQVLR